MIKIVLSLILFYGMLSASQERLTLEQLVKGIQFQENKKVKIRYEMLDEVLFESEDTHILNKLKLANNFVNQATYLLDSEHWKKTDYWATPHEFMRTGAGDSEDFALMKFYVLTLMGFSKDQLKIMIYDKPNPVVLKRKNKYIKDYEHIVLAYFHTKQSNPLVLELKNNMIYEEKDTSLLSEIVYEPIKKSKSIELYRDLQQ